MEGKGAGDCDGGEGSRGLDDGGEGSRGLGEIGWSTYIIRVFPCCSIGLEQTHHTDDSVSVVGAIHADQHLIACTKHDNSHQQRSRNVWIPSPP